MKILTTSYFLALAYDGECGQSPPSPSDLPMDWQCTLLIIAAELTMWHEKLPSGGRDLQSNLSADSTALNHQTIAADECFVFHSESAGQKTCHSRRNGSKALANLTENQFHIRQPTTGSQQK